MAGSRRARVLLAMRDLAFHQEVLDFLEREPRLTVVGAVTQPDALFRLANTEQPDSTVVCPVIARDVRHPAANGRTHNLLVVAEEMTVPVLREAIEAGANAVFAWPQERVELARTIVATRRAHDAGRSGRGKVIAVFGPRGGSGTTFMACHLAAALADGGAKCVLADLDSSFADVTAALGIDSNDGRTVTDLLPVIDELSAEHVGDALRHHARGFEVLLAPADPAAGSSLLPELYEAAVTQLATTNDVVVLHVPRSLGELARAGLSLADEVALVVAPDLLSLHAARRAIDTFGLGEPPGRCRVVINPRGGAFGMPEIERVLGIRPWAAIRFDPAVGRLQDRGELLSARSRGAARDVRALAHTLAPGVEAGPGGA